MNEMIERVAKAILAKVPQGYGMTESEAAEYARVAVAEMREPTDAMLYAGGCAIAHPSVFMGGPGPVRMMSAGRYYRAMISAAMCDNMAKVE